MTGLSDLARVKAEGEPRLGWLAAGLCGLLVLEIGICLLFGLLEFGAWAAYLGEDYPAPPTPWFLIRFFMAIGAPIGFVAGIASQDSASDPTKCGACGQDVAPALPEGEV